MVSGVTLGGFELDCLGWRTEVGTFVRIRGSRPRGTLASLHV